ncbi:MAG: DUF1549 domain-containing protein [Planctomycetes bacterium]|nr:DUF1549 domain-containing protein [Planctomycetota bacterium]
MRQSRTIALLIVASGLLIAVAICLSPAAADEPLTEPPITESDRGHWAFQPLNRPVPPSVQNADWCRTAIDRFILARLEKEKLGPAGEADRATLLRRLCFDLTGLPPSIELQNEVFTDESPDWYERLVDRLLASPSYGERWAQHWLDVARFAETDGFEHDHVRPNAWRFRDWVIDAHNRDLPLNEFIALQLAGDELRPGDDSALVATGFLFCGPDMPDINLQDERRHTFLNDMTGTVGSVFLGLQMGCAACHDHKYDPISQADFYRLRACFEVEPLFDTHPQLGQVMREKTAKIPTSRLMERGDFRRPGPIVQAAFPRIANVSGISITAPTDDAKSSGRRTSLATWLTRADNPLATRVLVNRIWQGHFGTGLVSSSSDFGVMGTSPTHEELLDWLATELPRLDWSRKRLHRLIVMSSVYRQASLDVAELARVQTDGSKKRELNSGEFSYARRLSLLASFPRRRLDGEAIRDALFAASGELNRQPGGPGFRPPLPDELVRTLLKSQWPVTPEVEQHRRRSVYLFARRNLRYPIFEAFDKPDSNASCPRRNVSTIAPQALLLLNADDSVVAAKRLAEKIERQTSTDRGAAIELAYRHILNRKPTADDVRDAQQFLTSDSALADLCLALFNLNEFVYVD